MQSCESRRRKHVADGGCWRALVRNEDGRLCGCNATCSDRRLGMSIVYWVQACTGTQGPGKREQGSVAYCAAQALMLRLL